MNDNQTQTRQINWQRIEKSIKQRLRRQMGKIDVTPTIETLKRLVYHTGLYSWSRRALRNIAVSLVAGAKPLTIISPICLSIPADGKYEPKASELVKKHVAFLEAFGTDLPPWKLVCLFPPPEKEDSKISSYIQSVCDLTKAHYAGSEKVEAVMMVDYAPGIIVTEESVIEEICGSPYLSSLSEKLTRQRSKYYHSLGTPLEFRERRTRRTMAQYIILGRLAALNGWLMCNHTTANIKSALYGGGGALHNPVGFM